ncbi:hypothetical protein JW887_05820 [Candidatus Dojkabacteria bacterium]|nr:hypothetical protein [Candidatus Dojkabacteria bacterium]
MPKGRKTRASIGEAARKRKKQNSFWTRIFRKKSSSVPKRRAKNSRLHKKIAKTLRQVILFVILLGLGGVVVYGSAKSVLDLKQSTGTEQTDFYLNMLSNEEVIGVDNVPVFPGSSFMYESDVNSDLVQSFLAEGKSAYTLPVDADWDDVKAFYDKTLEDNDWEHVMSVDMGNEDMEFGEYWIRYFDNDPDESNQGDSNNETVVAEGNNDSNIDLPGSDDQTVLGENDSTQESNISGESYGDDPSTVLNGSSPTADSNRLGVGLRIYTKNDDIWYELISIQDAKTGLSSFVAEEQKLKMILSVDSGSALPESFPWILKYPANWSVKVERSAFMDIEMAILSNDETSSGSLVIEPIDYWEDSTILKDLAWSQINSVNGHRSADEQFTVYFEDETKIDDDLPAYELLFESNSDNGGLCVVAHPKSGVVYVIATFSSEVSFYNFVVDNIESTR